jgi:hypothetical protein
VGKERSFLFERSRVKANYPFDASRSRFIIVRRSFYLLYAKIENRKDSPKIFGVLAFNPTRNSLKRNQFCSAKILRDISFFSKRRRQKSGGEKETPRFRDVSSVRQRKRSSEANARRPT